jgi:hypothetical protein
MTGRFLLNDNDLTYLIHGQVIKLEYQTTGCWFVVILYNNGESFFKRIFFRKKNGLFETVTNVYRPVIKLYGIGWGIKKLFHHKLHINFINTREQLVFSKTPELPPMPETNIRRLNDQIILPGINVKNAKHPLLLNNQLFINSYDDLMEFTENHPETKTKN